MIKTLYVLKGATCENWTYSVLGVYDNKFDLLKATDKIMKAKIKALDPDADLKDHFDSDPTFNSTEDAFFTGLVVLKRQINSPVLLDCVDVLSDDHGNTKLERNFN